MKEEITSTTLLEKCYKILDFIANIIDKHGIFAGYSFIVFLFMSGIIIWLIWYILKSKDKEIERIVTERNKFIDIVLKNRISSKEFLPKSKGGKR